MNKKADTLILEQVIFIILNIIFIASLMYFVYDVGNRGFIYEEGYAKQIALMIDSAEPGTAILVDLSKAIDIAMKNKNNLENIISLDKKNNRVLVALGKNRGYGYQYFSDYDINLKLDANWLSIVIEEKSD